MAYAVNSARPWFDAKLRASAESGELADIIDESAVVAAKLDTADFETQLAQGAGGDIPTTDGYEAPTVDTNFTEQQAQDIADAVAANDAALAALIAFLDTRGIITTAE